MKYKINNYNNRSYSHMSSASEHTCSVDVEQIKELVSDDTETSNIVDEFNMLTNQKEELENEFNRLTNQKQELENEVKMLTRKYKSLLQEFESNIKENKKKDQKTDSINSPQDTTNFSNEPHSKIVLSNRDVEIQALYNKHEEINAIIEKQKQERLAREKEIKESDLKCARIYVDLLNFLQTSISKTNAKALLLGIYQKYESYLDTCKPEYFPSQENINKFMKIYNDIVSLLDSTKFNIRIKSFNRDDEYQVELESLFKNRISTLLVRINKEAISFGYVFDL